ncbi:hypothetical protein D5018_07725 [Parashewanella curva]|uniref:Lipoprotein n=1 Tax=Parashewanella curva TaxID=2338552 RepID=A0A3L8PY71_9GAMM|nr:hypothetical protein [Parashewanella curva]RLV60274.1 hypothetical protein D5018_07725 [Parashewanella curva]
MKGFIALSFISLLTACSSNSKLEFDPPLVSNVMIPQRFTYSLENNFTLQAVSSPDAYSNLGKLYLDKTNRPFCTLIPAQSQNQDLKYRLIYAGKLSGHTIFSPYAEYTDSHYYQVVFLKK